ncbi:MAG: InlB B-repeat-containing protein [Lachnospiraceae bacterium]|nr:InlB B-repeat-containing protein [Lachnospiraceae bacterium]
MNVYDIDLSEAALAWFMYNSPTDPLGGTEGDQNGLKKASDDGFNTGGHPKYAAPVVAGWVGPIHEDLAKYTDATYIKNNGLDPSIAYLDEYHVTGYQELDISTDPDAVKQRIMENGAVSCSIYNLSSYYNSEHNCYYYPSTPSATNHAVTIVGWDDNFPKENFKNTPAGNGAWLIRNSGMSSDYSLTRQGYYYLSYYDKGLNSKPAVFAFEYEDGSDVDNCYQYDGGMLNASKGYTNYALAANVFTVSQGAVPEAVTGGGFYTGNVDQAYKMYLYKDIPEGATSPLEGKQAAVVSGNTTAKGYYSSYFNEPVYVEPGSRFALVVRLEKKGQTCSIGYEANSPSSWSTYKSVCQVQDGQGYVYTTSGGWKDANTVINSSSAQGGNLRIKAYSVSADRAEEVRQREAEKRRSSSSSKKSSSSSSSSGDSSSSFSSSSSSSSSSSDSSSSSKEEERVIKTVISPNSVPEGAYGITYDIGVDITTVRNLPTVTVYRPGNGMKSIKLPKPVRTGYVFKGWSLGTGGAKVRRITKKYTGNLYLTAMWEPIRYRISFFRGTKGMTKDTAGKIDKIRAVYDEEYVLPESGFLKTGYELVGYTTDKKGTTVKFYPGEKVKNLAVKKGKTVKLYAIWELSEAFKKKDLTSSSSSKTGDGQSANSYVSMTLNELMNEENEEVYDESLILPSTEAEYEAMAPPALDEAVTDEEECVLGGSDDLPAAYMTPNLPPLKSQSPYETCWSFSVIACAEIYVLNHGDYKDRYEKKGSYKMPDHY